MKARAWEVIAVDKETLVVRVLSGHDSLEKAERCARAQIVVSGLDGPESFAIAPAGNYRTGDEYGQTYL